MAVMQVGIVRVLVHKALVPVPVAVRLFGGIAWAMRMLMVGVMDVPVLVVERLMHMPVFVPFGEMQVNTDRHEGGCANQRPGWCFPEKRQGKRRADKGRGREIGTGACSTEMAQAKDK